MINRAQTRRLFAMAFLVMVAFAGLGYRLVELQVIDHDRWRRESEKLTHKTLLRTPKRGDIKDARGRLFAGSILVKTVFANPEIIGSNATQVAQTIAPILGLDAAQLAERITPRVSTNSEGNRVTNQYVVLKRQVPMETFERLQSTMKRFPLDRPQLTKKESQAFKALREWGISGDDEQLRFYPNGRLAAHVIGSVTPGENESPLGKVMDLQGAEGVELSLNRTLTGSVGWRKTEVAQGREVVSTRAQDVQAHAGRTVVLTIDSGVQNILESELAEAMEKHTPISASGLVIRPKSGEILAMATLPNFDPADPGKSPFEAHRNRIVTDLAEPGSTFKIVVVSGALNDKAVTLEDKFDCENGRFLFAGRWLRDHEPYPVLSVEEIITHSSNIGAAKIGIRMGQDRLHQYIRDFGFGVRTGIPLVGEREGLVNPLNKWTKLSISRVPMGHEVAVTPLQMVMAMCAIANGGRLMRPLLVDHLEDENGQVVFRNCPQQIRQVVTERAALDMVTALKTVVRTNGTGKRAVLEHYTVAGKTGTAQKVIDGRYRSDHHFSSFIGFFPADNPEVCIAVFLDDPKHGYYAGEAAAPVFRDIAERTAQYLAIKSDVPDPAPPVPTAPSTPTAGGKAPVLAWNRSW